MRGCCVPVLGPGVTFEGGEEAGISAPGLLCYGAVNRWSREVDALDIAAGIYRGAPLFEDTYQSVEILLL